MVITYKTRSRECKLPLMLYIVTEDESKIKFFSAARVTYVVDVSTYCAGNVTCKLIWPHDYKAKVKETLNYVSEFTLPVSIYL